MMARVTAESIVGQSQRFELFASIPHSPFPGGKLLRRPALAIGMSYFKLLDEL